MLLDWKKKLCLSHELNDQFIRYIFDLTTTNKFSFDKLDLTCIVRSLWETTIITLREYVLIRIIYHEIKKSCKNICAFEKLYLKNGINQLKAKYRHSFWWELGTRSDILQGQALFRGVKQLRRCLVMLNNFEKISFPSIEKRWT